MWSAKPPPSSTPLSGSHELCVTVKGALMLLLAMASAFSPLSWHGRGTASEPTLANYPFPLHLICTALFHPHYCCTCYSLALKLSCMLRRCRRLLPETSAAMPTRQCLVGCALCVLADATTPGALRREAGGAHEGEGAGQGVACTPSRASTSRCSTIQLASSREVCHGVANSYDLIPSRLS